MEKKSVNAEVKFFSSAPTLFAHEYYSKALQNHADKTNVKTQYNSQLISVDKKNATFKNTTTGETFSEQYDFLHVVPHMQVPDFLKGSKISNSAGFVDIDMDMNHKIYKNVWAVGDCIALPNAKTAASVFSQVPVVVENLQRYTKGMSTDLYAKYDGYASCPLFVGDKKLMLAEFRDYFEDGEKKAAIDESFLRGEQNIPREDLYNLTLNFTQIYSRLALNGLWYGKNGIFNPFNYNVHRGLFKYAVIRKYRRILYLATIFCLLILIK